MASYSKLEGQQQNNLTTAILQSALISIFLNKLETIVGVGVSEVGVAKCSVGGSCVGGCWARVELGEGFVVVDGGPSAVVSPRVVVRRGCGCNPPQPPPTPPTTLYATSAPHHNCPPHTCLNGGRCLPNSSSVPT